MAWPAPRRIFAACGSSHPTRNCLIRKMPWYALRMASGVSMRYGKLYPKERMRFWIGASRPC